MCLRQYQWPRQQSSLSMPRTARSIMKRSETFWEKMSKKSWSYMSILREESMLMVNDFLLHMYEVRAVAKREYLMIIRDNFCSA